MFNGAGFGRYVEIIKFRKTELMTMHCLMATSWLPACSGALHLQNQQFLFTDNQDTSVYASFV
jgi:hypothetical protein